MCRQPQSTPKSPKAAGATAPQLPHDPKVPAGSRPKAPQLPAALRSPPRRQAQSAEAAAGARACNGHVPPHQPSGPNRKLYIAVAALAGLFVAVAIVVLLDMLNTRVRSVDDAVELLGVPVIGRFPVVKGGK